MKILRWLFVVTNVLHLSNRFGAADLLLSTTNINSSNSTNFYAASKLFVTTGQFDTIYVVNTGTALEFFAEGSNVRSVIFGSTLGTSRYKFSRSHISFSEIAFGNTGVLVDGVGAPIMVDIFCYNIKYGNFEQASTKPDGIVVLRVFVKVEGLFNPFFTPLEPFLQQVVKPGSSTVVPDLIAYPWFNDLPFIADYYQYRGLFSQSNGAKNFATVFVAPPKYATSISVDQFNALLNLRNCNGQPLTGQAKLFKQCPTRVTHIFGRTELILLPGRP